MTVTDKEVKIETETTLTCSLTELTVEVTISWWDGESQINDGNGKKTFRLFHNSNKTIFDFFKCTL